MNRRKFLQSLGLGSLAPVTALVPRREVKKGTHYLVHTEKPEVREEETRFDEEAEISVSGKVIQVLNRPSFEVLYQLLVKSGMAQDKPLDYGIIWLEPGWRFWIPRGEMCPPGIEHIPHVEKKEPYEPGPEILYKRQSVVRLVGYNRFRVPTEVHVQYRCLNGLAEPVPHVVERFKPVGEFFSFPVFLSTGFKGIGDIRAERVIYWNKLTEKEEPYSRFCTERPSAYTSYYWEVGEPIINPCPVRKDDIDFPLLRRMKKFGWKVKVTRVEVESYDDAAGHHEVTNRYEEAV